MIRILHEKKYKFVSSMEISIFRIFSNLLTYGFMKSCFFQRITIMCNKVATKQRKP